MQSIYHHPVTSQPFINNPKEFLSTKEVKQILKTSKVVLLKPDEPWDIAWTVTALIVSMFSFYGGMAAFFDISERKSHVDHSNDVITDFQIIQFDSHFDTYYLPKDNRWINHCEDIWKPNVGEGLKAWIPIATLPLILIFLIWKMCVIALRQGVALPNKLSIEKNKLAGDLMLSLLCSSPINRETPVRGEIIRDLVELELISDELLKKLSFSQIKYIREIQPVLFEELLLDKKFSEVQCCRWNKLDKMLNAAEADLRMAILNSGNKDLFQEEPIFLETLIQELQEDHFTESIQRSLSVRIQSINDQLGMLEKDEALEITKFIHSQKCSLEEAFQKYSLKTFEDAEINLLLHNECKETVTFSVSRHLLCKSSAVFERMRKWNVKEESPLEDVSLHDVDPECFKELIGFLRTGHFDFDNMDIALPSLLRTTNAFAFTEAHTAIDSHFCSQLNLLYEENELTHLLELCRDYNLIAFKKAIGFKISQDLPSFFSDDFLPILEIVTDFSLNETRDRLSKKICREMESLSQDSKFIPRLVEAVKINESLLEKIFPTFASLLERKPKLLKSLWDNAKAKQVGVVLDLIILFCKSPENAHITLANWAIPPTKNEKVFILESLEIEDYI